MLPALNPSMPAAVPAGQSPRLEQSVNTHYTVSMRCFKRLSALIIAIFLTLNIYSIEKYVSKTIYDSSADFWKLTKDGNIEYDGQTDLFDENGKLLLRGVEGDMLSSFHLFTAGAFQNYTNMYDIIRGGSFEAGGIAKHAYHIIDTLENLQGHEAPGVSALTGDLLTLLQSQSYGTLEEAIQVQSIAGMAFSDLALGKEFSDYTLENAKRYSSEGKGEYSVLHSLGATFQSWTDVVYNGGFVSDSTKEKFGLNSMTTDGKMKIYSHGRISPYNGVAPASDKFNPFLITRDTNGPTTTTVGISGHGNFPGMMYADSVQGVINMGIGFGKAITMGREWYQQSKITKANNAEAARLTEEMNAAASNRGIKLSQDSLRHLEGVTT